MPIYTYHCDSCGIQFEKTQKFSDPVLNWCPECNKKALRKVYTPVGIVFKGSGFYSTDNKSPSGLKRSAASEEKNAGEKAMEKSAENTEPAPAKKETAPAT